MKLSIITVNYNNKAGLQKTIDSVITQTFKDYEWIIIDGGSSDGSKELIEQYSQYITYWISEPDNGIYHAMNKGILVAKGEYLQFLNSGDALYKTDTLYNVFIKKRTADIIYGDIAKSQNGHIISYRKFPNIITLKFLLSDNINHQATFLRRTTFEHYLYDTKHKICADRKHFINTMLNKGCFEHINDTLVIYDITGISSHENIEKEKLEIFSECLSPHILSDYQRLFDLEQMAKNELVILAMNIFHTNKYIRFATRTIINLFLKFNSLCQKFL